MIIYVLLKGDKMTREELLYKICPTDTTFDCRNGNKNCNCDDCVNEMNVWLEEYDNQIISEVIDKIIEELELHSFELGTDTIPVRYVRLNKAIEIVKKNIPLIH